MNHIIEIIKNSKFANDVELANTVEIIEAGSVSPFMESIVMKSTLKRIATLEANSINLPTNLFSSSECKLIEDFMLHNKWSKFDINDADAYKGKYYIYDNTPKEIRVMFYKDFKNNFFVEVGDETIKLS